MTATVRELTHRKVVKRGGPKIHHEVRDVISMMTPGLWRWAFPRPNQPDSRMKHPVHFDIELSGNCERAGAFQRRYRSPWSDQRIGGLALRILHFRVRCRHCAQCRRAKSYSWAKRSEAEMDYNQARSGRVWWLTLTLRDRNLRELENRAYQRVCTKYERFVREGEVLEYHPKTGEVLREWGPLERKRVLVAEYKREIQLALKRLHEETGLSAAQMRQIYAFEFGEKRGRLHAHMLLLENGGTQLLTKVRLRKHFHHGNVRMNLLKPDELRSKAFYLTKYMTKEDLRTRQCASLFWGDPGKVFFRGIRNKPGQTSETVNEESLSGPSHPYGGNDVKESATEPSLLEAETVDTAERNCGRQAIAGWDPRENRGAGASEASCSRRLTQPLERPGLLDPPYDLLQSSPRDDGLQAGRAVRGGLTSVPRKVVKPDDG